MKKRYLPDMESIKTHQVPDWYDHAKLGIFIHWGAYSVPAWAPVTNELGSVPTDESWFSNNPYAEWYYNSVNVGEGPTYEYHKKTYGENFPYENFTHMWKAENWHPSEWARLFRDSGARYTVITTKHHDGFCLWPSKYTDYNTSKRGPMRDIVGELKEAVELEGIRFGTYYSGLVDWTYAGDPIWTEPDLYHTACPTNEYADFAYKQATELIDRYNPSILWNDIGWPVKGNGDLPFLYAHYYNTVEEGVVNDRWNDIWWDFRTKEYQWGSVDYEKKWEMVRGMGLSFGYNTNETEKDILSAEKLTSLLIQTVANNGNLMINIGPRADGTIQEEQKNSLLGLGAWLKVNGEAVYGTSCYNRRVEKLDGGEILSFTRKDHQVFITIENAGSQVYIPHIPQDLKPLDPATKASCSRKGNGTMVAIDKRGMENMPVVFSFKE